MASVTEAAETADWTEGTVAERRAAFTALRARDPEGASSGRFQTVRLSGIQDPIVLRNPDAFHDRMIDRLYHRVRTTIGEAAGDFHISLRLPPLGVVFLKLSAG